jgi:hypothetical protein
LGSFYECGLESRLSESVFKTQHISKNIKILIGGRHWLFKTGQSNPFKHSTIDLTQPEQLIIYVGLFGGTMLLMFWIASTSPFIIDGLIPIGVALITSWFIIITLKPLLGAMREDELSYRLVLNQNFLLTAYLIILTELSFLNWYSKK